MANQSKITPRAKSNIKAILDIFFIILLLCSALVIDYIPRIEKYEIPFCIIVFVFYLIQYTITKKWVTRSFTYAIDCQAGDTSKITRNIINLSSKQKEEINTFLVTMDNAVQRANKLKNTFDSTMSAAKLVSDKATLSLDFSQKEQNSIKANIAKMDILKQKIQIIAGLILDLSEHTQQIGDTIYVIDDIAEQTNMLALNAAVEAARAGEHGKGFSIVAGEIRKLADESKQATMKITSLIKNIQQATNSTVMATEEGSKEIEAGVELAGDINKNIDALISTINDVKLSVEKIYSDSQEQVNSLDTVSEAVSSVNNGLKTSLKSIDDKISSIESLDKLSDKFKESIG